MKYVMIIALLVGTISCGGSGSETPPPVEPVAPGTTQEQVSPQKATEEPTQDDASEGDDGRDQPDSSEQPDETTGD